MLQKYNMKYYSRTKIVKCNSGHSYALLQKQLMEMSVQSCLLCIRL